MTRLTANLAVCGTLLFLGAARDASAQYGPSSPGMSSVIGGLTRYPMGDGAAWSNQPSWPAWHNTGAGNTQRYAVLPRFRTDYAPYLPSHPSCPPTAPNFAPGCQSDGSHRQPCPRCSRPCPAPAIPYRPPCDNRDLPCRPNDACVLKRLPPVEDEPSSFGPGGVNSFINIFSAAVARGVENATIRAFNSTQVCPSYQKCPPCECLPCQEQPDLRGCAPAANRPPAQPCQPTPYPNRHVPIPANPPAHRQPPCATEFPVIFWDHAAQAYLTLDAQGRRKKFDPRRHSQLNVRLNLVTGATTVEDEQGRVYGFDPRTIPPRGLWWNLRARRLETGDSNGGVAAFDPGNPEFDDLVKRFDLELDASSKNTIVTHKQTGTRFLFEPLP